jgi:hypothetical protein
MHAVQFMSNNTQLLIKVRNKIKHRQKVQDREISKKCKTGKSGVGDFPVLHFLAVLDSIFLTFETDQFLFLAM